jgi:hypothetical protein
MRFSKQMVYLRCSATQDVGFHACTLTNYVLSILANKMLIGPTKHFRKKPEQEFAQGLTEPKPEIYIT